MSTGSKDTILSLLKQHESWRQDSLNLVAAENNISPLARSVLSSELAQRYGDYTGRDLSDRRYFGTRYIVELEVEVSRLAMDVFGARYVELRPLSGHIAGDCVIMGLCQPGDLVLELGRYDGGHRIATKLAASPLIDIEVDYLPFDDEAYNIDVQRTLDVVRERHPRLVIVGSSNFLFPIPLQELAEGLKQYPDTVLVYDASHVLGLIAGGRFQKPLNEGAHLVIAGTQKSFPGPQGGIIYSHSEELISIISATVYPAVISNHHLARLPSLGIALTEMQQWGAEYADQVIRNAKALAQALVDEDIRLVGNGTSYTESHSVMINTASLGSNAKLGQQLDSVGIIVSAARLPHSMGGAGLRLGTNELTRRGALENDMAHAASLTADILLARRRAEEVAADVQALAKQFEGYRFTWPNIRPYVVR